MALIRGIFDESRRTYGVPRVHRALRTRGVQYACGDFRELLDGHGIASSMSRKGNCYANTAKHVTRLTACPRKRSRAS